MVIKKKLLELNKLLRTKYKIEEMAHTEQQIKECAEKRCEYILNEQSKMIDGILEREKKIINLDRCIIKDDNGDEILLMEKEDVLKAVKDHFNKISNMTKHPKSNLEKEWENEYKPLENLEDNYFENIMDPIQTGEWIEVLNTLPNGKAAEHSKISYEMIKKSSTKFKEILKNFLDLCLNIGNIPNQWNKAIVYPIPKPGDWELNLSKIRPITLLEIPRKILMKILTNRLSSKLLANYEILKDHNYAGLPGKSTQEPIHILNAIMEDAREAKKELWILMQDMSKAYDLVNRNNLIKALKRIKLPNKFIEFISNSLKNRTNQIISDFGFTESFKVGNGIDQGEIMSPLLWVIYYDPLFSKIEKIRNEKNIGYNIGYKGKPISITDLAYMDDSTWIGKKKNELELILQTADSFNEYNGIKVNKEKSKLIVINNSESKENTNITYGLNSTKIQPLDKKSFTRFLGVWIGETDNKNFVKNQIKSEIDTAYNIMKYKKIIDDQVRYIYNVVIIPRVEYKMLITILSREDINTLTAKIRRLMRNKMGISNTAPNIILTHKDLYNLIDLFYRQGEAQITNLLKRLNNSHLVGEITEIKIRLLQEQEGLYDNPMDIWNYNRINLFKNNLIAKILCITKDLGLNISTIGVENKYNFKTVEGEIKLSRIFKDDYRKYKNQLKKKQIFTLDQITSNDGKKLLEWRQIPSKNAITLKGKIPQWFKKLEMEVMENESRTLKNEFNIQNNKIKTRNQRILLSTKIDYRKNNWVAGIKNKNDNNIYIGMLFTKKPNIYTESMIEIIHYRVVDRSQDINRSNSLHMVKCEGCDMGLREGDHCKIILEKKYSILIISKVVDKFDENQRKIKIIEQMIEDIIMDVKSNLKSDEIPTNIVNINITEEDNRKSLIENIIGNNISLQELMNIYIENKRNNRNTNIFYTDGSLKRYENYVDMGVGWVQIENELEISRFNAKTKVWPSSTRVEVIAILTAILTVNYNSEVSIFTDSKNTLSIFNSYKEKYSNYRSYIKLENQIIWELIFRVIDILNLTVNLHKVKAHTNIRWNDRADEEANLGRGGNLIIIKNSYSNYKYQLQYYNISIDTNPRNFVKNMNNILIQNEFNSLNRNKIVNENIDKNLSLKIVKEKYWKKGITLSKFRNFHDHNFKAFNVKKLLDELPTIEKLKIRRPDLYKKDLKCVRCNRENEDLEHLWNCNAATNDIVIIGLKSRRLLEKILGTHKSKDDIIEAIHKYTMIERELKSFHTEANTEYYRRNNDMPFHKKYIWDGKNSMDSLLRGWVPRELFQILRKHINQEKSRKYFDLLGC